MPLYFSISGILINLMLKFSYFNFLFVATCTVVKYCSFKHKSFWNWILATFLMCFLVVFSKTFIFCWPCTAAMETLIIVLLKSAGYLPLRPKSDTFLSSSSSCLIRSHSHAFSLSPYVEPHPLVQRAFQAENTEGLCWWSISFTKVNHYHE